MRTFTAIRFNRKEEFNNLVHTENFKEYFNSLSPEVRATMVEANKTYVSWPSKDSFCPSPHATGGSVDVWLFKDGEAADLGVPFDWMEEEAGAFYHLKLRRKRFFVKDEIVCRNRETLLLAMSKAGFSCYGLEIWHFNCGNQMDALVRGGFAVYSYIEP